MRSHPRSQHLSSLNSLLRAAALGFLMALLAGGCVYRIDIQQGNFLDADKVSQLTEGMTRSQVRYLLGTPLSSTPFGNERWDYIYYFKRGHSRKVEERKVTVYFAEDKVTKIERPAAPAAKTAQNL